MFDAQAILNENPGAPSGEYGPLPAGTYTGRLAKFETREMKSGNGNLLNLEFDVDFGSSRRKVWTRLNLGHTSSPKAVTIATEQLAHLCMAAGFRSIQDPWNPVELIGQDIEIVVGVDGSYNDVKAFKMKSADPVAQGQALYGQRQDVKTSPAPAPDTNVDDEIPF